MVDFDKLIGREAGPPITDPLEIFAALDREEGLEFPRPAQEAALKTWFQTFRDSRDAVIKLPTGHGKTLIGLLILQSYLNDSHRPALYLCPNTFLVSQTVAQATSFGIQTCTDADAVPGSLPDKFLNGERIYVTTCKKLFNGMTLFGGPASGRPTVNVNSVIVDDAHKCVEEIRSAFSIRIERGFGDDPDEIYASLLAMFKEALGRQAPGTVADILEGKDKFLMVPYWSWTERHAEVIRVLQENNARQDIEFAWDFLKDHLADCQCFVSGRALEIAPRLIPLHEVPTFERANHRVFLSATLAEDSFLVRDLGVAPEAVLNPIVAGDIRYCGERLVVLPTLVKPSIQRDELIKWIVGLANRYRSLGFVVLVPSGYKAEAWENAGAEVVRVREIEGALARLRTELAAGKRTVPLVLMGQYDGIDLPGDVCRVLCLDSLPAWSSLPDRYAAAVRQGATSFSAKEAQRIEQGMGRGIRGPNDWCMVIAAGNDLTGFLSANVNKQHLSPEAQTQIAIGQELAAELSKEGKTLTTINKLIDQCIKRDEGWRKFYRMRMASVNLPSPNRESIQRATSERQAELEFEGGRPDLGEAVIRDLASQASDALDKGWYHQSLAERLFTVNRPRSLELQVAAQNDNKYLLKPERGVRYEKISGAAARARSVLRALKLHSTINEALVAISAVLDKVSFDSDASSFELGTKQLGEFLGFETQRPEAETGASPDDLWALGGSKYWVIECKNEVRLDRVDISKSEAGQMAVSAAWFKHEYHDCTATYLFAHPAALLAPDAFLSDQTYCLTPDGLAGLKSAVKAAFASLQSHRFDSLAEADLETMLRSHSLDGAGMQAKFLTVVKSSSKPRRL